MGAGAASPCCPTQPQSTSGEVLRPAPEFDAQAEVVEVLQTGQAACSPKGRVRMQMQEPPTGAGSRTTPQRSGLIASSSSSDLGGTLLKIMSGSSIGTGSDASRRTPGTARGQLFRWPTNSSLGDFIGNGAFRSLFSSSDAKRWGFYTNEDPPDVGAEVVCFQRHLWRRHGTVLSVEEKESDGKQGMRTGVVGAMVEVQEENGSTFSCWAVFLAPDKDTEYSGMSTTAEFQASKFWGLHCHFRGEDDMDVEEDESSPAASHSGSRDTASQSRSPNKRKQRSRQNTLVTTKSGASASTTTTYSKTHSLWSNVSFLAPLTSEGAAAGISDFRPPTPRKENARASLAVWLRQMTDADGEPIHVPDEVQEELLAVFDSADDPSLHLYTRHKRMVPTVSADKGNDFSYYYRALNNILNHDHEPSLAAAMPLIDRMVYLLLYSEADGCRRLHSGGRVWKGDSKPPAPLNMQKLIEARRKNTLIRFRQFQSSSSDEKVAQRFQKNGDSTGYLWTIDIPEGFWGARDIRDVAWKQSEGETLFPPYSAFKVIAVTDTSCHLEAVPRYSDC